LFDGPLLLQVVLKPHGTVKDTDDVGITVRAHEVDDSVVTPDEDPNVATRRTTVRLTEIREALENLSSLVDRLHALKALTELSAAR
jgi:hypothetical protein